MNNQKLNNILKDPNTNWKYIAIVAVVGLVALAGVLAYQRGFITKSIPLPGFLTTEKETPEKTLEIPEQPEIPTDWKTYTNDIYGFEFKYPPGINLEFICNIRGMGFSGASKGEPGFIPDEECGEFYIDRFYYGRDPALPEARIEGVKVSILKNAQGFSLSDFIDWELKERGWPNYPYVVRATSVDLKLDQVIRATISEKESLIYPFEETRTLREPMNGRIGYIRFTNDKILSFSYFLNGKTSLYESILSTFKFLE